MKLIVGLGNPGREYKKTRHNLGFMVIDNYLGKVSYKLKHEAYVYVEEKNGEKIIFAKPLTYMNLSGLSVKKLIKYYKVPIEDVLIIHDDLDLPVGSYKIKKNSSSGGHNGIKSIISELNSMEFARLKIGIGKSECIPTDKYVLSSFSSKELKEIMVNFDVFNEIIDSFINEGIEKTMVTYNNR